MDIVTRFAPSPTGHLHIGGARTAIFSWLLARHCKGKFLLRIEDTDLERSKQEYTDSILASMSWLGLEHDGEIAYQSKRLDLYSEYVDKLLASGHAYWCECSPEEVEAMREEARAKGEKPRYNGRCRERNLGPGPGRAVRLKAPLSGRVAFEDMVKGHIAVDASELDDMVLCRADGAATYNLAVVVDDAEMKVTHVLRGDDHVNNTPKQILIYQALGLPIPVFGHVPMILGPDRQKLSKRHGAKAVIDYQQDGLLPAGLVNYLARLGWSHKDQEIFSRAELIDFFDGKNMSSSAAGFDPEKLLWVNAQHLRGLNPDELAAALTPFIKDLGAEATPEKIKQIAPLFQSRASDLKDMAAQMLCLLLPADKLTYQPEAVQKALNEDGKRHVAALAAIFANLGAAGSELGAASFDKETLHQALQKYVEDNGLKFKAVGPALRVSLLGGLGGPDLAEVMQALGREETLARLARATETI
ncbi:MAG: glutamate--tRNA ligase [Deltaproteobacteria bacterium]|nr:glutamate--tRNA ligase [Deltaproteobacteria bacterium]